MVTIKVPHLSIIGPWVSSHVVPDFVPKVLLEYTIDPLATDVELAVVEVDEVVVAELIHLSATLGSVMEHTNQISVR